MIIHIEQSGRRWMRAAGMACALLAAGIAGLGMRAVWAGNEPVRIVIVYPLNGTVFPPDMAAPTVIWRDPAASARTWKIEVTFANGATPIRVSSVG